MNINTLLPKSILNYKEMLYFEKHGEIEVHLMRHLCEKERDAIDVGANSGEYIHFMRRYSRHVTGFEPQPLMYNELVEKFGHVRNITISPVALSDKEGVALLQTPIIDSKPIVGCSTISDSAVKSADYYKSVVSIEALTQPLDKIVTGDVGMIKIDVEGHEEAVLWGAMNTISRCQPRCLIEIDTNLCPSGGLERIKFFFRERRYEGFFVFEGQLRQMREFHPAIHQNPANRPDLTASLKARDGNPEYVSNFLFLPLYDGPALLGRLKREIGDQHQRRQP